MATSRFATTRRTVVAAAAVALIASVTTPAAYGQASKPKLTGLGQETLVVEAKPGEPNAVTHLSVLNAGAATPILVTFQASSTQEVRVDSWDPPVVGAGTATRVTVVLRGVQRVGENPIEGQLIVDGGETPVAQAVTIIPAPQPALNWPAWIIYGSIVAFVALVATVLLLAAGTGRFRPVLGRGPGDTWDFDSWATSLVAAAGLFATLLGGLTLPPVPSQIDKTTLVQLNLLFVALLAVGPLLFLAARNPRATEDERRGGLWSWNIALLISTAFTGAAVLGELGATALLGWELVGGGTTGWFVVGGVFALAIAAVWYFITTAYTEVTVDWKARYLKAQEQGDDPQQVAFDRPVEVEFSGPQMLVTANLLRHAAVTDTPDKHQSENTARDQPVHRS